MSAPLRRGPLTDEALSWIAALSRHDLEALGRTADRLEDETLALAVVAECGRRDDGDAVETGEHEADPMRSPVARLAVALDDAGLRVNRSTFARMVSR